MTLGDVLRGATDYLDGHGVPSPRVDAELLLAHALGLSRIQLYTQHDRPLTEAERTDARELVRRRAQREPLAYILGEWGFRRLVLKTDPRALIPRPETEIVVERALALIGGIDSPRVLDVGTGTGAIALAIAQEHPGARVLATDTSQQAVALATENATALELPVEIRHGDLLAGSEGPFDLIVSNPPYVLAGELPSLEVEVREHEPRDALVEEGQTERLADVARDVLEGWLVLEVHEAHADAVVSRLTTLSYADVRITPDLAGKPRVVEARWQAMLRTR